MQDINSPYSRCTRPECGKEYRGWTPLQPCVCGSPTVRYVPTIEEIMEENRMLGKQMEQQRQDPAYQKFIIETRQALLGDVALCLYFHNRRN